MHYRTIKETLASPCLQLIGILLLYGILFLNTIHFDFVWDDRHEIMNNQLWEKPILDGLTATQHEQMNESRASWIHAAHNSYRPVRFLSYKLDELIHGMSASGMHLHNVLLGIIVIVCVYMVTGILGIQKGRMLISLIFAIHPLQVEPVAYISARSDLLSGMWAIVSLSILITELKADKRNYILISLGVLAYLLSIMAKESSILLPVFIAIWAFWHGSIKQFIIPGICLLTTLGVWLFIRKEISGATHVDELTYSFSASVFLQYLKSFFLPIDCSIAREASEMYPVVSFLVCIGLYIAITIGALLKGSQAAKNIHVGFSFLLLFITPSLMAITVTNIASDRYMYLPILGAIIVTSETVQWGISRLGSHTRWFVLAGGVSISIVMSLLLVISYTQIQTWNNASSMYRHAVSMVPTSGFAWYGLGYTVFTSQGCAEAEKMFIQSVKYNPKGTSSWNNLGVCQLQRNQLNAAIISFKNALNNSDSLHPKAWYNLGETYVLLNRYPEACNAYYHAFTIQPDYPKAHRKMNMYCHHLDKNH